MKTFRNVLGVLLLAAAVACAQFTTTSTTLTAAMSVSDQTISLTSSTGVTAAGQSPVTGLYIDREYMTVGANVNSAGTGNVWTVKRGVAAGLRSAHVSGAVVWVGPPSVFDQGPNDRVGACTAASLPLLPIIMVRTGNLITCGNGQYTTFGSFASRMTVGAQVTMAASLTLTNPTHFITGSASNTITTLYAPSLPATGGCVTLIPQVALAGTTSTGGNIALATTFVVSKMLTLCKDPGTGLFYPSY